MTTAATTDAGNAPDLYRTDRTARGVELFADVDDEHLRSFHQHGYLIIHRAFPVALVEAASRAVTGLIDGQREDFTGVQFEPGVDEPKKLSGEVLGAQC